jgi:PAS domain S-box-containing protein
MIGHHTSTFGSTMPYTVLLIGVEPAAGQRYQQWLQQDWRFSYTIIALETGEAALKWCKTTVPDLLLLDFDLPDGNGLAFLQRLVQHVGGDRPLPLVLLISDDANATPSQHSLILAQQAIQHGAQDYLIKEQLTADLLCRTAFSVVERVRLMTQVHALTAQLTAPPQGLDLHGDRQQHGEDDALRQSEVINRAIRNALPDLLICMKRDGTYLDIKPTDAFPMMWAASVKIGQNVRDILPTNAAVEQLAAIERALQTRSLQTYEMNLTIDEQSYCQEVRIVPLSLDDVLILIRDVTDRKLVEDALRQSEASLLTFVNALPDLVIRIKRDGTRLVFSPGNFKTLVPLDKAVGNNIRNTLPADLVEQRLHYIAKAIETGQLQIYEYQVEVEGTLQYEEARIVPSGDDDVFIIVRDISDRKRAEKALAESEARYRAILQGQTELILRYKPDGTVLFANDAFCRYFGYSYDDIVGKPYEPMIVAEDRENVAHLVQSLSAENPIVVIENRVITGGQIRWTQWVNQMIFDEQGQFIEYQGVGRDIHDRKQVELELQQAKEAAEVANRMKSLFLANMSHELRTPLNVILGFAQVMSHDVSLSSEQQEHLQIIRRSGDHLLHLINNILDLSKIEAERMTLDERPFDLMALLETLQTMFTQRAEAKGLQLRVDLAPDLPAWVTADANKLQQILMNLLSNAIKFTETGQITLRVTTNGNSTDHQQLYQFFTRSRDAEQLALSPSSMQLYFEVEDTGIGIASDDLPKIFSAFVQAQTHLNTTEGTGLGLTISGKFVELMGGYLLASSALGQGSLFSFTIPVGPVEMEEVPKSNERRRIVGIAPGQPTYRILVVDDQPENRRLMVKILTQFGLEVQDASNGDEAVQQWSQWHPHLILMDLRMPQLDGYDATRQIRAMQHQFPISFDHPHPVIIALTARASSSDRALALASGCNDFICKPFRADELFVKLETYLGLRYLYAEVSEPSLRSTQTAPPPLTTNDLAIMPSGWLADLHRAVLDCDDEAALRLVGDIPSVHSTLISGLKRLIHNYQFKAIAHLTKAAQNL